MSHTVHDQKALLTRVRRIAGQAAALEQALEQGSECSAVLQQIAAIRGAVNGLMAQVWKAMSANTWAPKTPHPSSGRRTSRWSSPCCAPT